MGAFILYHLELDLQAIYWQTEFNIQLEYQFQTWFYNSKTTFDMNGWEVIGEL